ncbi:MAG: hypothetical protein U0640_13465 [Phycisphaerales bacterium]
MSDRLLDKFTKQTRTEVGAVDTHEGAEAENLGCFGWLRGVRDRALMLELRKKDGHVLAIAYSWLERVEFQPDEGITLHLPGRKVRIKGSGLNQETGRPVRLFDGITRHRVPWIREADRGELLKSAGDNIVVESIQWDE